MRIYLPGREVLIASLLGLLATSIWGETTHAQSLFERRSQNQIDQYRDYAARNRGDTLSVMIMESTDVENRDERIMDKRGQAISSTGLDYGVSGALGDVATDVLLGTNTNHQRNFLGNAQFRTERALTDRFSVTVVDVLPNGNLVVRGSRLINVQNDARELTLTGVVRQYDILPGNSIPSYLVADLQLTLNAKGAEQAFTNQGWLARKFNRYWPF
ncbi:MAG: flagellar basal body L-ring protein FlgH [Planctomycetota bacterium]